MASKIEVRKSAVLQNSHIFLSIIGAVLLFHSPLIATITGFGPRLDYPTGDGPRAVFAADLDGDGDTDLAVGNADDNTVSIFKNNGDGTFAPKADFPAGSAPLTVIASNFDGDSYRDLAVGNQLGSMSVLKNNGNGTFASPVNYATGPEPRAVFAANVDGDGDMDLAVANFLSNTVAILKNNGDGTFVVDADYSTDSKPHSIFLSDLDGDLDVDIATANVGNNSVTILINNGGGVFSTRNDYSTGNGPNTIFIADFDGDGDGDIVTADQYSNTVTILKNDGHASFSLGGQFPRTDAAGLFGADLDADSDVDLVAGSGADVLNSNTISVFENNGDGTFIAPIDLVVGFRPVSVFASDLDGDGDKDLITANSADNTISIFKNCASPAIVTGRVTADCPAPVTGLPGVEIDAFRVGTGELVSNTATNASGNYELNLENGQYMLTIVTPLGYRAITEEVVVSISCGGTIYVDFQLTCAPIVANPRTIGFWKHQVGVATGGNGRFQIDAASLCKYLDLIEDHFNSNLVNQVIVYQPPASGLCADKLTVAKQLLNLSGSVEMIARARQQLLALLLNVAAGYISQTQVISSDGATVSQAITYCDNLIDDPNGDHEKAKTIADLINNNQQVPDGIIPPTTVYIAYRPAVEGMPERFELAQNNPNPFNPTTIIEYALPQPAKVELRVFNILGQMVRKLVDEEKQAGYHQVDWDGRDEAGRPVSTGIYLYQIRAGDFVKTMKMSLVK